MAVRNAPQAVKDAADVIAGTNDEDGASIELERILNLF